MSNGRENLAWLVLGLLVVVFGAIVLIAPPEKTLGETIRLVYSHVAFTRAGIIGFYAAGILGLVVVASGRRDFQQWAQNIAWVALGLFIVGGFFSVLAQRASWGGVTLAEPSNRTSLSIVAVAAIILIGGSWVGRVRLQGALYALLAGYVAWILPRTPLVLHPENAGGSSPSLSIRYTFPVLTVLAILIGIWWIIYLGRQEMK